MGWKISGRQQCRDSAWRLPERRQLREGPCRVGTAEARKRMKQRGAHEGLRDAGRWRITV